MSDQSTAPTDSSTLTHQVGTNGSRTVPEHELAANLFRQSDASIEHRLSALRNTIQGWDWRGGVSVPGAPSPSPTLAASATSSGVISETPTTFHPPDVLDSDPLLDTGEVPVVASVQSDPATSELQVNALQRTSADASATRQFPIGALHFATEENAHVEESPPTSRSTLQRRRIGIGAVGALAVVGLVIGIVVGTSGSPGKSPAHAAVVNAPSAASSSNSALTSAYLRAAKTINASDGVLTHALNALHGLPTVIQLDEIVTPYSAALQRYEFELAAFHWPAAMSVDSQAVLIQLQAFTSLVQSISSISAADLGAWLNQFHTDAQSIQASTDKLRSDLGLSATS
jgi:hypothetical protein